MGGAIGTDHASVAVSAAGVLVAALAVIVAIKARGDADKANKLSLEANQHAKDAVEKAERQANAAERAVVLSVRPVIVGDPEAEEPWTYRTEPTDKRNFAKQGQFQFDISFPVRNVGIGPALIHSSWIETPSHGRLEASDNFWITLDRLVLAPGETALFYCKLITLSLEATSFRKDIEQNGFSVFLRYMDIAEGQRSLTVINLKTQSSTNDLRMTEIRLFTCDQNWKPSQNPFASNTIEREDS